MEHKKPRASTDELAACRAAAWAWYQRGVGSEDAPVIEEIGVTRIQRVPKPSRFKLEAIARAKETVANCDASEGKPSARGSLDGQLWEESDVRSLIPTLTDRQDYETSHSTNSLLDMYEIEMISKRFDSLAYHGDDGHQHGQEMSRQGSEKSVKSGKKVKKKSSGFWALRPSAVCGSGGVVEPIRLVRKYRQKMR